MYGLWKGGILKKKQSLEEKDGRYFLSPPRPQKKCGKCGHPRKRRLYLCKVCGVPKLELLGSVADIIGEFGPVGSL